MPTKLITLTGGGPWGFSLSGGKDFGTHLRVSEVIPGGKAARGGLKDSDYIIAINGDPTEGLMHSDAQMMIKATGRSLQLKLSSTAPKGAAAAAKFGSHDQPAADQSAGRPNPPPPPQSSTTPTKPPTTTYKSVTSAGQSGGKPYPPPPSQPSTTPTKPPTTTYKSVTSAGQSGGKPHPPPPSQSSTIPTKPAMTSPGKEQHPEKGAEGQGVCDSCNQPIRGAFASAMGRVWHPEHFICTSCRKELHNTTFTFNEEKIICESCYELKFAKSCFSCHEPIVGNAVTAQGYQWHVEHFRCSMCNTDLSQSDGFNMEESKLFCSECFTAKFAPTCHGCGQKTGGQQQLVQAMGHAWHTDCFVCQACKSPLQGKQFHVKDGKQHCSSCA